MSGQNKSILHNFLLFVLLTMTFNINNCANVMKIEPDNLKYGENFNSSSAEQNENSLEYSSSEKRSFFPPDLHRVFLALDALPNSFCKNDSKTVMEAVISRERWALKMFDSSPKFPTGMLYGSYYQLGNFDECISIKESFKYSDRVIQGQYRLADIALDAENGKDERVARSYGHFHDHEEGPTTRFAYNNTLRWAICVPSSCSPQEVEQFLDALFKIAISYKAIAIQVPALKCHYEKETPFTTLEIVYGSLVGVVLVVVLLATIYHLLSIYRRTKCLDYNVSIESNKNLKIWNEIIMSFSLIRSITKLLHIGHSDLNLDCIFGIKFISMLLIIASHTLLFSIGGPVANEDFYKEAVIKPQNSILLNNPLLVDTFLLLSGFLMCRLLLLELDKRKGRINILFLYIARYIRLTPSYLVVIGLYCTFLIRFDNGPLWNDRISTERDRCIQSWWANILYINNYINIDHMCMFQSWYLSVDTHLFVIAPFIIYPLWKWPRIGELLLGFVTFVAVVVPFTITYVYELDPTLMAFPAEISDIALNSYFLFAYIKTHMRATSYCIGLITGYVVHKMQLSNTKMSNTLIWMMWILAITFGLASVLSVIIFYLPAHKYNALEAAAYSSLHKISWSIFVAWTIISCVTDNSEPLRKFLSWAPFVPLSRLTYCAYLVNGLIVLHGYGTLRAPTYMSVNNLASVALAHMILTFTAAFILCILFESPIHSLEKCILGKANKPNNHHEASVSNNKL